MTAEAIKDHRREMEARRQSYDAGTTWMLDRLAQAIAPKPAPVVKRNGCYDHPPFVDYVEIDAAHGYENKATRDCRYRLTALGKADKGCKGCKHREPGATA